MKLIIDIPEKAYNRLLTEQHLPNRLDIEWCIVHGTPIPDNATVCDIDAIRQEIEQKYNDYKMRDDYEEAYGLEEALMIIDQHMRGDSE